MERRHALIIGAVVVVLAGGIAIERAIVTDGERIDEFVDAVTGTIKRERIDAALPWFRPNVQPFVVEVRGESDTYGPENSAGFAVMCHARLRPFDGVQLVLLSKQVEIQGSIAKVSIEIFSRLGRRGADFELRKHGDDWLVSSAVVR